MAEPTMVIVGGGLAGASAAAALREEGFAGRVVLLAGEKEVPYNRPPLSKEYLMGRAERSATLVHPADWYAAHEIDLRLGAWVASLDLPAHEVVLAGGERLGYTRLLLATGSSPRHFRGAAFPSVAGVHHLRTVTDAEALRAELAPGGRSVVVVGSGWIALEVAAAARGYGNEVTVLGRDDVPLEAALGHELGAYFAALHARHGVEIRMRTMVESFEELDGHVIGVGLAGGSVVPADVVVVGSGAVPNAELALVADLPVSNGVLVDSALHAGHDVYAAGDVANAFHPALGGHLRVDHWDNARRQGRAAARSMLGKPVSYDRVPYFFTDQFDLGMEFSGYGPLMGEARVVYRGMVGSEDGGAGEFLAFWVVGPDSAARVVAGMNVNVWDVHDQITALVASARPVDVARLQDPAVDLREVWAGQ